MLQALKGMPKDLMINVIMYAKFQILFILMGSLYVNMYKFLLSL